MKYIKMSLPIVAQVKNMQLIICNRKCDDSYDVIGVVGGDKYHRRVHFKKHPKLLKKLIMAMADDIDFQVTANMLTVQIPTLSETLSIFLTKVPDCDLRNNLIMYLTGCILDNESHIGRLNDNTEKMNKLLNKITSNQINLAKLKKEEIPPKLRVDDTKSLFDQRGRVEADMARYAMCSEIDKCIERANSEYGEPLL